MTRLLSKHILATGAVILGLVAGSALASAGDRRIIAVGGAVTEIVLALGAGQNLIAVDTTSTFPAGPLQALPRIGYMRQIPAEGVVALAPSEVLAIEGSGPADALTLIRDAGVAVTMVPDIYSAEGVAAKIRRIGAGLGRVPEAEALASATLRRFAAVAAGNATITRPARVLFALSTLNGKLTASGNGTAADAVIRLAGAVNAVEGFSGYKALSDEAIIAARPDAILVMDHAGQKPDDILAYPALAETPAARARRLFAMDGLYLLGFGPRAPDAVAELRARLYPGLGFPTIEAAP